MLQKESSLDHHLLPVLIIEMVIGADRIGYNNIKADSQTLDTIIEIEAYLNQLQYGYWSQWNQLQY